MAVDGTTLNLPNVPALKKWYGYSGNKTQARGSQLFDVMNRLTIDAAIFSMKRGERALALEHLKHTKKGDLVIYDRGYPAFYLFAAHMKRGVDFCARIISYFLPEIIPFIESGKEQLLMTLTPNGATKRACKTAIQQDFFAKILSKNLVVMFAEAAQVITDKKSEGKKWRYQINYSAAVASLKHKMIKLLFKPDRLKKKLQKLREQITHVVNAVRPERSFVRKVRQGRKHHMAYKQPI